MNLNKFTIKSQEVMNAQMIAMNNKQQQIDTSYLKSIFVMMRM